VLTPGNRTADVRTKITIRVPADLQDKMKAAAKVAGLPVNAWIIAQLQAAADLSAGLEEMLR
jgi:predicted HicB family RNase H-like nuclease